MLRHSFIHCNAVADLLMISTCILELKTQAGYDVQDITPLVFRAIEESKINSGIITIFCAGSTGGLTTLEFEPGVVADLRQVPDEIMPPDRDYAHHQRWGDDNGSAHVRAALMGPSLTVPLVDKRGGLAAHSYARTAWL